MKEAELSPDSPPVANCVPGIAQSLALCALFFGMSIAVSLTLTLVRRFAHVEVELFLWLLAQQVIAWPVTIWVGLRWSRVRFREACPLTRFPIRIVPALLIATFGATILLLAGATLIPIPEQLNTVMAHAIASSSRVATLFSVVLVGPVAEELFFRGLVLRGYLARYSMVKAVWASALLFAFFHLNPWQALVALPLGLGFAWLFVRTGSLVPSILCHATANFSTNFLFYPLALLLGYDSHSAEVSGNFPPSMLAIGAVMTSLGGFILFRQLYRPR